MPLHLHSDVPEGCISDLRFDEWDAGELMASDASELERHAEGCDRCNGLRALRRSQSAYFLERSAAPKRRKRSLRTVWLASFAAASTAAAALVVAYAMPPRDDPAIRTKGSPHLGFYVKRAGSVFEGTDGQRVRPADQLRFTVSAARVRHVAVLSRDTMGKVSVYYPTGALPQRIEPGHAVLLGSSIELDDSSLNETLFGLFCETPIDLPSVEGELARTGSVAGSAACSVDEIHLVKEPVQ